MEWPQPVEAYVVAGPQVVGHPSRLCAHRSICVLECQKNAWQKRCKRSRTFSPHARDMENTQSWLVRLVAALRRTTRKAPWMATHNCCRAAVPTVHASVAQKSQCPPTSPDAAGMHNYRWDILETTAYIVSRRPAPPSAAQRRAAPPAPRKARYRPSFRSYSRLPAHLSRSRRRRRRRRLMLSSTSPRPRHAWLRRPARETPVL